MTDTLNGEAIRLLRGARGWTLRDFAGRVGISPGYLSKIERAPRSRQEGSNVSPRVIDRVAHVLGVPTQTFTDQAVFLAELAKATDRPDREVEAAYWDARVPRPYSAVA